MAQEIIKFGRMVLKSEGLSDIWKITITHSSDEGFVSMKHGEVLIGSSISKKTMLHEIAHIVCKTPISTHHMSKEFSDVYVHLCSKYLTKEEQLVRHGIDDYIIKSGGN